VTHSFLDFFDVCGFSQKSQKKPHTTLALKSEAVTPVTPVPFGAVQYILYRCPVMPVCAGICTVATGQNKTPGEGQG